MLNLGETVTLSPAAGKAIPMSRLQRLSHRRNNEQTFCCVVERDPLLAEALSMVADKSTTLFSASITSSSNFADLLSDL